MADRKNTNIANGILSAIVLLCGIIFSTLIGLLFKKLVDMLTVSFSSSGYSTNNAAVAYGSSPIWSLGFAFMVPGLIGVIASLARNKCGYVVQMVFCILTLVIMGIFFIVGILALMAMSLYGYGSCTDVLGQCVCSGGQTTSVSLGTSCSDLNAISGMSIGATVMMVLGWIFALAACITGGMLACGREDQPGVVIGGRPGMQMGTVVVQQGQGYPPPQGYAYAPQGYAQGYAPQGQGYAPQGQGYAPQGQGYAPQGQDYTKQHM